ncbi:unnamed protein product [Nezara viridula]|uniref:Ras-associating domain-containing protein n=1 Tax=Nezara viridula TaxID=85310 RepID=A0A9P0H8B7_NEZVI|nr:unnamed protein product [Nezara viridula]
MKILFCYCFSLFFLNTNCQTNNNSSGNQLKEDEEMKKPSPRLTMDCMTFPWSSGVLGEKTYKIYGHYVTTTSHYVTKSTTVDPVIEKLLEIFH